VITERINRVNTLLKTKKNKKTQQVKEEIRVKKVEIILEEEVKEDADKAKLISAEIDIVSENSELSAINKLEKKKSRIIENISMTESTKKIVVKTFRIKLFPAHHILYIKIF
jgi:hypothetical protein